MATVVLRNLAHDIIWALLALASSLAILGFSFSSEALVRWPAAGGFLLITVGPSVAIWTVVGLNGLKSRVSWALCSQILVTILSMTMLYMVRDVSGIMPSESEVALLGFSVFAGLKVFEFLFFKYRRALLGQGVRVLFVGDGLVTDLMEEFVKVSQGRYVMLGRVGSISGRPALPPGGVSGEADITGGRLLRLAKNLMADKIVVSMTEKRGCFPLDELLSCKLAGIEVLDAPTFYESATRKLLIHNINPSWFIFSHGFKVTWFQRFCKRVLDICVALAALLFFIPFIPFIALAIALNSPGPILFRQTRVGQGDLPFTLLKFRTMRENAELQTGAVWSQVNDGRITSVGHFLRRFRLDEIPQLWNILIGDMSVVGPRPERPEFVMELKKIIPYYSERHYVKPGLTGWAQVSYEYGSSVEDAIEKLRYDLYYIKNISTFLDIKIILKTFYVVLLGRGR